MLFLQVEDIKDCAAVEIKDIMDLTEYSTRNSIGCTSIKPIQSKHKSKNEVSSNILETVQEQSENEEDFESMT